MEKFALMVNGSEMSPRFLPGDQLVVDLSVRPKTGDPAVVYACWASGEKTCHFGTFKALRRGKDFRIESPGSSGVTWREGSFEGNKIRVGKVVDMIPDLT